MPLWQQAVGKLGGMFLGLVLLTAAYAKAIHPALFVEEIQSQGLDFLLPATVVAYLALALEIGIGVGLLLSIDRPWMLWLGSGLVAFFIFLNGRNYWLFSQGLLEEAPSCGCFGNLVQRTPAEAFWQDLLLIVPPLLLAIWGRSKASGFPSIRVAAALVLAVGGVGFASIAPDLPLDDWATRLSPGVHVDSLCLGGPRGDPDSEVCLEDILPAIGEGTHLVILTNLDSPEFVQSVEQINQTIYDGRQPTILVASPAEPEQRNSFFWAHGPAFEIGEVPLALIKPFYRRLPRSFRVEDGIVTHTYDGLPPLGQEAPAIPAATASSGEDTHAN
ncbi:MAG: MauE/DoxX family redox-associated membrane protein [Acidobacteriota bacterium]